MPRAARFITLLAVTSLALLFGVGCVLAALFEIQGFGGPRGQGPRPLYLAALALGLLGCLAAPVITSRLLGPDRSTSERQGSRR